MSKQYQYTCDMCGEVIKEKDHATVRIIRQFNLKGGRPNATQERTYDIHIDCLTKAGVPVPTGEEVEVKE